MQIVGIVGPYVPHNMLTATFYSFHVLLAVSSLSFSADFSKNVSGSYRSELNADGYWLELRVDIDPVSQFSEVLNMLSGDIFEGNCFKVSFMCEEIEVEERGQVKVLTGEARFPTSEKQESMKCEVCISQSEDKYTANVKLMQEGQDELQFNCERHSSFFRKIHVEIDYDNESFHDNLPTFNSRWHRGLKEKYGERQLDLFGLYKDAGVNLIWNTAKSDLVVDPTSSSEWEWTDMITVMKQERGDVHSAESRAMFEDGRNEWNIWLLLGDKYASTGMLGVMFDVGKGETTRNGTAVFVDSHGDLPSWEQFDRPQSTKEAVALWNYLFTLVHEVGHTLNLPHSFFPSQYFNFIARPEALSFMNYPDNYQDKSRAKQGLRDFFTEFMFTFTREELVFIRHMSYDVVRPGMGKDGYGMSHSANNRTALTRFPSVADQILDLKSA